MHNVFSRRLGRAAATPRIYAFNAVAFFILAPVALLLAVPADAQVSCPGWGYRLGGWTPSIGTACAADTAYLTQYYARSLPLGYSLTFSPGTPNPATGSCGADGIETANGPNPAPPAPPVYPSTSNYEDFVSQQNNPGACPSYKITSTPIPNTSCASCNQNSVAEPIDPAVGNVLVTESDFAFSGTGGLGFRRFFNSADTGAPDLSYGWRHSFSRRLMPLTTQNPPGPPTPPTGYAVSSPYASESLACSTGLSDLLSSEPAWSGATGTYNGSACLVQKGGATLSALTVYAASGTLPANSTLVTEVDATRDDGEIVRFVYVAGRFVAPPGQRYQVVLNNAGYVLTDGNDTVESYSNNGVLQSITLRGGIRYLVGYDTSSRVSTVTDSFGNSLTLAYNTASRLASVTPSGGTALQYGYDGSNRLGSVTFADLTSRTYVYENASFPGYLTGIIDESNIRYSTWTYYPSGRAATSSEGGGANATTITYNSPANVTVTDALGANRTFAYARVGDRLQPTSISGSQCSTCAEGAATTYDLAGFVSSRTDYDGNLTCYSNDSARGLELVRVEGFASGSTCPANLSTYTPAGGTVQRKITSTWHAQFQVPMLITESNRTTGFTYDGSGNRLTTTVTDTSVMPNVARTWTDTYDSFGRVLTVDGPRTDVVDKTTYTYYTCTTGFECGQVHTVMNALSQQTTFNTYNVDGLPLTTTDANGVLTTLGYDARYRLTSRQVGAETTGFSYYSTRLLKTVTLPDLSTVTYNFDNAHRLTTITDGAGNKISYGLDASGHRTSESAYDPSSVLARTHTWVYNTLGELYKDIGAANTAAVTTTFGYDGNGNAMTIAAPLSRTTGNLYDALNRVKQVTDPITGATGYLYDSNDNLMQVTDPRNLVTSYQYTGFGDVKQVTSPDTGTTTTTYDSGGNPFVVTDARTDFGTHAYDALNRVTSVFYKKGASTDQTVTFTYDVGTNGIGRLTGAGDAGHSMTWGYDGLGRVTSKGQTIGTVTKTVGYAYTSGNLTTLTTPSGQSVVYSYSNGQVTGITINGTALLSSVAYEPFGPVRGWTWGNTTTEVRLHNTDGNPSQVSATESSTFGYDDAFRITGITNASNSALSWIYGYDLLDRVTSASKTGTARGWSYDANGNRLTQTGSVAGTYTPASTSNRLSTITGTPARTYGYDSAGNTLSYSTITYAYWFSGRMKTATVSGTSTSYNYNALGQRIKKSGGAPGTVLMVYDEAGHLLGEYTSTGTLVEETIWLGDIPVATIRPGTSAVVYYVHADHLNAPRMVTQSLPIAQNPKVAWRWDTDPFGTAAPNENPQSLGTFKYHLRYPGQYYDAETGLFYNYFRDYDPQTGRYVESDPIGLKGGINTYAYASDAPSEVSDSAGLVPGGLQTPALIRMQMQAAEAALANSCPRCQGADRWSFTPPAPCSSGDAMCGIAMQAAGIPGPYYSTTHVVSRKCMLTLGLLAKPVAFVGSTYAGKLPAIAARALGASAEVVAGVGEVAGAVTSLPAGVIAAPYGLDALYKECTCDK